MAPAIDGDICEGYAAIDGNISDVDSAIHGKKEEEEEEETVRRLHSHSHTPVRTTYLTMSRKKKVGMILCIILACVYLTTLSRPRGLTFLWWGCHCLCLRHKPTELAHSFIMFLRL